MATLLDYSPRPLPRGTGTLALWWFLGGLFMLFFSAMLGYIAIRLSRADDFPIGYIDMPGLFWLSTAVVFAASATIQLAVMAARRDRLPKLRFYLGLTLVLGIIFCVLQAPALYDLLMQHRELAGTAFTQAENEGRDPGRAMQPFFGLIAVYVFVHAAHVIGGMIHLLVVNIGALRDRYDHEFYAPVKHAAMYWHFLDVVWVLMFGTMVIFG